MPPVKLIINKPKTNKRKASGKGIMSPPKRTGGFSGRKKNSAEKKFLDTVNANTDGTTSTGGLAPIILNPTTYSSIIPLNLVSQGPAANQRVGQKIKMKNLKFNLIMSKLPNIPTAGDYSGAGINVQSEAIPDTLVRWFICVDTQCNGQLPAISDIVQMNDAISGSAYYGNPSALAPISMTNRERFRVLRSEMCTIGNLWKTSCYVDDYINLREWDTTFNGSATGAIGSIATNSLLLVMLYYSPGTTTTAVVGPPAIPDPIGFNTINVDYFARLRYEDV